VPIVPEPSSQGYVDRGDTHSPPHNARAASANPDPTDIGLSTVNNSSFDKVKQQYQYCQRIEEPNPVLADLFAVRVGLYQVNVALFNAGEAGFSDFHDGAGLELLLQHLIGGFIQHLVYCGQQGLCLHDLVALIRITD
jgi:hypothetical protein